MVDVRVCRRRQKVRAEREGVLSLGPAVLPSQRIGEQREALGTLVRQRCGERSARVASRLGIALQLEQRVRCQRVAVRVGRWHCTQRRARQRRGLGRRAAGEGHAREVQVGVVVVWFNLEGPPQEWHGRRHRAALHHVVGDLVRRLRRVGVCGRRRAKQRR
eukprot:4404048-Prymnesium_polylepis.1